MTGTLTPEHTTLAERVPRVPAIAANLLPVEIVQSRRLRKVRLLVLSGLVAFALALGGWYGQAVRETRDAQERLDDSAAQAQQLVRRQQVYAELTSTQAESKKITTQLAVVLADDLQWSHLLGTLRQAAPPGVLITGVSGGLTPAGKRGATGAGKAGAATLPANPSGEPSIGSVTVIGTGRTKAGVAGYVDTLADLPGVASPMLASATLQEDVLHFTVRLEITKAALDGRHSSKSTTRSGGK